ncbi:hypothetical protein R6Z07F_010383 [Ovis aries]
MWAAGLPASRLWGGGLERRGSSNKEEPCRGRGDGWLAYPGRLTSQWASTVGCRKPLLFRLPGLGPRRAEVPQAGGAEPEAPPSAAERTSPPFQGSSVSGRLMLC